MSMDTTMDLDDAEAGLTEPEGEGEGEEEHDQEEQQEGQQEEQEQPGPSIRRSSRQKEQQKQQDKEDEFKRPRPPGKQTLPQRRGAKQATSSSTSSNGTNGSKTRNGRPIGRRDRQSSDIPVPQLEDASDNEEQEIPEEYESSEDSVDEDDEEADTTFRASTSARGGRGRGRGRGRPAGAGRPSKANGVSRPHAQTARRKRPQTDDEGDERAPAAPQQGKGDFEIEADNTLFNAVVDPNSALATIVEEWDADYRGSEDSRGQALADLINFVLRTCGCNASVDLHEAQDLDGIVDKLDDIQLEFQKIPQANYPLISRSKTYKTFHAQLQDFLSRLVHTSSESDILYDDTFCETLQSWLVACSSSKLRAFRHTSTVITLVLVEAFCEIAKEVEVSFGSLSRQRDAEQKKKRGNAERLKEMEASVKSVHRKKTKLEEYFKEIFDAVFVHRYRDAEASIRMECIKALGQWMKVHPDYFLEGNYLRYIGWTLTDLSKEVRLEAVKSLTSLYAKDNYIGSMQHFTERFKPRLVEIATSEYEIAVRVAAIHTLRAIDKHGLLEDEQRDEVGRLVYDAEPRVRKAVGEFCEALLEEDVENRKVEMADLPETGEETARAREQAAKLEKHLALKSLAAMLVKFGEQVDSKSRKGRGGSEDPEQDDEKDGDEASSLLSGSTCTESSIRQGDGAASLSQVSAILQSQQKDRVSSAVEGLWNGVKVVQDWEGMLEFLLLDHSSTRRSDGSDKGRNAKSTAPTGGATQPAGTEGDAQDDDMEAEQSGKEDQPLDEVCRLNDAEETLLLNVFAASVGTTRRRASLLKDDEARDEVESTLTRTLMNCLPRLLAKHQSDAGRTFILLVLPQHMKLSLYLDLRSINAYEALWDDVSKQFLASTDALLLERSMATIMYFKGTEELSRTNAEKTAELQNAVVVPLFEASKTVDVETAGLDDETRGKIGNALGRLVLLGKNWDVSKMLDEKADENQQSVLSAVTSVSERGSLGYREDEKMICHALELLNLYYFWRIVKLSKDDSLPPKLVEFREKHIERMTDLSFGGTTLASEGVKRSAFKGLLELQIACQFRYGQTQQAEDSTELSLEVQYKCAGFVQAEIERYARIVAGRKGAAEDDDEGGNILRESEDEEDAGDSGSDQVMRKGAGKRGQGGEPEKGYKSYRPRTLSQRTAEYAFHSLVACFCKAICVDVLDLHHASAVLTHYGRFGPFYDECCTMLGNALRHYGVYGDQGEAAAGVVSESLKASLTLYLAGGSAVKTDLPFLSLGRLLSNHVVVRKGFNVVKRLPSADLVALHTECLTFVISKIAGFESQEKKASRSRALAMFKALVLCLAGVNGKEAAKIQAHLSSELRENAVTPVATAKAWEPYRSYEKRLFTLMSKDSSIKAAARKQTGRTGSRKSGAAVSDGEGGSDEDQERDGEGVSQALPARSRPKAKPSAGAKATVAQLPTRSLPARSSKQASEAATSRALRTSEDEDEEEEDNQQNEDDEASVSGSRRSLSPALPPPLRVGGNDNMVSSTPQALPARKPRDAPSSRVSAAPSGLDETFAIGDEADEGNATTAGELYAPSLPSRDASPSASTTTTSPTRSIRRDNDGTPTRQRVGGEESQADETDSLAGIPDSPPLLPESQQSEPMPPQKKRRRF